VCVCFETGLICFDLLSFLRYLFDGDMMIWFELI
jgi:hypothetical protein